MPTSQLRLTLRLDPTDPFGALERVLSNARRTGVALQGLQHASGAMARTELAVAADDDGLLHLFTHRLENTFDVEVLGADFVRHTAATPAPLPEALAA